MLEGGWLRSRVYMDSYTRWWVTSEAKHNYCEPRAARCPAKAALTLFD